MLDDYPRALRELGRHEGILTLELYPRVWRFLLMVYPGGEAMLQRAIELGLVDRKKPITPRAGQVEVSSAPHDFEAAIAAFGAAAAKAVKRGKEKVNVGAEGAGEDDGGLPTRARPTRSKPQRSRGTRKWLK